MRLLGDFHLTDGADAIVVPAAKQRALLAYLACEKETSVTREIMIDLLWGDQFPEQGRQNLRQALSQLRRKLGASAIPSDGNFLRLAPELLSNDVDQMLLAGTAAEKSVLVDALALWRGAFLLDVSISEDRFETWQLTMRSKMRETYIEIARRLAETYLADDDPDAALATVRRAITLDPYRDDLRHISINALVQSSRRGDAVQEFRAFESLLDRELGITPDPETASIIAELRSPSPLADSAHLPGMSSTAAAGAIPSISNRPVVVVLPFDEAEGEGTPYFATGISDEIISRLPCLAEVDVMSRTTGIEIKKQGGNLAAKCHAIGARYALTGTVQRVADRVRVFAELFLTDNGASVWNARLEVDSADLIAALDDTAERVIAAIGLSIEKSERVASSAKSVASLSGYDYYLRALPLVYAMTRRGSDEALSLLEKSLLIEPDLSQAAGLAAWTHALRIPQGWVSDLKKERTQAIELAHHAFRSQPQVPDAIAMGGYALSFLGPDPAAGLPEIERALKLNPSLANGWTFGGWVHLYVGSVDRAGLYFDRAMYLNPLDPMAYRTQSGMAFQAFFSGQYDQACHLADEAIAANADYSIPYRAKAAALAKLKRLREANAAIEQLRRLVPGLTATRYAKETRFREQPYLSMLIEALIEAGLPSG